MYKVRVEDLKSFKKQLEESNKILSDLRKTPKITKQIKANEKQIRLIENEYYSLKRID